MTDDERAPRDPTRPIVSIITPTYNHRRFIGACIASVIGQTEQRWEQIVVDDGSTDGTGAIVQATADPRIRYIHREHRGIDHLGDAYNTALALARAPLIAVLEGDDFWPPDKLAVQLPMMADPSVVLSWGFVDVTDGRGITLRRRPGRAAFEGLRDASNAETFRALLERNFIPASTVVCRRDALDAIGGFQQPPAIPLVDYPTWLDLSRIGRFTGVDHVLGFFRRHENQVTVRLKQRMDQVLNWGVEHAATLPPAERRALGLSDSLLARVARERRAELAYEAGREQLRQRGDRSVAAAQFRRAMRGGVRWTRIKASVALAMMTARLDPERLFGLRNRLDPS